MKSNHAYSAAGAFAATVFLLAAREATSSGQTSALVRLQSTTPGVAQTGNANLSGTITAGQFQGGGAGLTSLTASNISSGTLSDARLSPNVALLNGVGQTFTTPKTFSASPSFTNATAPFIVTTTNKVGNLNADLLDNQTGLFYQDATNLTAGLLSDARLSTNVALLASNQTFTGQKTFSQFPSFSNATVPFSVTSTNMVGNLNAQYLAGQGAGYYKDATNLTTGTLSDARLSTNVATLSGAQTLTGQKTFNSNLKLPNGAQAGHVLVSDATGTATWQSAQTALPVGTTVMTNSETPPNGFQYTGVSLAPQMPIDKVTAPLVIYSIAGYQGWIYAIGESKDPYSDPVFYRYEIASGIWTRLPDPPFATAHLVSDGKIYLVKGSKVWSYSTSWVALPDIPVSLRYQGLGSAQGDLYVIGGIGPSFLPEATDSQTWRFNPTSGWTQVGNMKQSRAGLAVTQGNFTMQVYGGTASTQVEQFNLNTGEWEQNPTLQLPYALGGWRWPENERPEVEELLGTIVSNSYVLVSRSDVYQYNSGAQQWKQVLVLPGRPDGIYGYGSQLFYARGDLYRTTLPTEGKYYMHRKL